MSLDLVIVTGVSGAGKTTALKIMEDFGFFCVDNMPISLIDTFVRLIKEGESETISHVSMGIDIRSRESLSALQPVLADLKAEGIPCRILYLDCDDSTLIKRYKETRRTHPLSGGGRIEPGLLKERAELMFLKDKADYILDTSQLLTRDLRAELERIFIRQENFRNLMVTVLSFGFKYGIPEDADLVFDVRFLPNPYYVLELRELTGKDVPVRDFLNKYEETEIFLKKQTELIRFLIPYYMREGKTQLVIAVGCTGGKHRSVALAEALYHGLSDSRDYGIRIEHRDIEKDAFRKRA
ncbi:MAG: RNase adapter RapZ [Eubacterium sp.]|nr:RNase adapter RapZ [Eubacterium sp.]